MKKSFSLFSLFTFQTSASCLFSDLLLAEDKAARSKSLTLTFKQCAVCLYKYSLCIFVTQFTHYLLIHIFIHSLIHSFLYSFIYSYLLPDPLACECGLCHSKFTHFLA